MESETKQYAERFNKLINHNGGYVIIGSDVERQLPYTFVHFSGLRFTAISKATKADADKDCEFLGLPQRHFMSYWYKCVTD